MERRSGRWKWKWTWRRGIVLLVLSGCLIWYYFSLPAHLFNDPYSTILESREGELLSASIARDGQWRFPPLDSVPNRLETCLLTFEDRRFHYHPGVDLLSMAKATQENIVAGKIVRGGSTVTMQVIRLARKGKSRTFLEKAYEVILATRLELRYSKAEIMKMYASHAPFGGNVVGIEAACWRYFGRGEKDLSWAEAAFLAVLPNAPALVHPGRNRDLLLKKRNALLDALVAEGYIDSFSCDLAKAEPIPDTPHSLPRNARHLLTRAMKEGKGERRVRSTISYSAQQRLEEIMSTRTEVLSGNGIHNGAALIADVSTGAVIAYVGNSSTIRLHGSEVDVITSPRSTGSILKPILYAAALDEGKILPRTFLPDVPTFINGFTPKNFTNEYDGVVNADKALVRSLNIPAVFLLREYRYEKFHSLLRNVGLTTLTKPADHYGLSLILGGAEGTLWDIAGVYGSMGRTLKNYFTRPGGNRYTKTDFHPLTYERKGEEDPMSLESTSWLSASAVFQTFNAMLDLNRPDEESGWQHFESSQKIAWKTGTSFGFRDAWAVGVNADYVVAVWVGNADGEGRPGLTGVKVAGPALFEIFSSLKGNRWFAQPTMEMKKVSVCRVSGARNGPHCPAADTLWISTRGLNTSPCNYHKLLHLSQDEKFQVNTLCVPAAAMIHKGWFVLPPVQDYYYRTKNVSYKSPPPLRQDCWAAASVKSMDLVYPKPGARLFIPRDITGESGSAVFQLAHRNASSTVYWYMDGHFLGRTHKTHHLALNPPYGKHKLMLIDESGESIEESFEILSGL